MQIMSNYDVFFYIIWGMVTDPAPLPPFHAKWDNETFIIPLSETTVETSR